MFCIKSLRLLSVKHLNLLKNYSFQRHLTNAKFFEKILDFSSSSATNTFLRKHDYLMNVETQALSDSVLYLQEIGITAQHIREQPKILCTSRTILQNQHEILSECGCSTINVHILYNYYKIIRNTEDSLKLLGFIDNSIDLQQRLASRLNVKLNRCREDAKLTSVRFHFLQLFFVENGYMSAEQYNNTYKQGSVRHKSYRSIEKILNILTEQLRIPNDKIVHYKPALKADPDQLQKLLTIKPIGGVNIEDIVKMKPALMLLSADSVQATLKELEQVEVKEELLMNDPDVLIPLFGLEPIALRRRLNELKSQPYFDAVKCHPMFWKLIVHNARAEHRMEFLQILEKKCFNFSAITGSMAYFQSYIRHAEDKHMQKDCILFFETKLQMDAKTVKEEMFRHPYWLNVPLADIQHTIDTLKSAGFELEDIRANVHIVLYSGDLVVSRCKKFSESDQFEDHRWADLPKAVQLKLVLYDIELERHFSGDGVWLDRKYDGSDFSR